VSVESHLLLQNFVETQKKKNSKLKMHKENVSERDISLCIERSQLDTLYKERLDEFIPWVCIGQKVDLQ
jgi:hypothetical protein